MHAPVHANGTANGVHRNGEAPLTTVSDGSGAAEGRTAQGTFAPGNKHGKGNPFTRRIAAKRAAFANAVTDEEIAALARELYRLALQGDLGAAKLFLAYAIGLPTISADPDDVDLDAWRRLYASPTVQEVGHAHVAPADPALASKVVGEKFATDVANGVNPATSELNRVGDLAARFMLDEQKARVEARANGTGP